MLFKPLVFVDVYGMAPWLEAELVLSVHTNIITFEILI